MGKMYCMPPASLDTATALSQIVHSTLIGKQVVATSHIGLAAIENGNTSAERR